MGIESMAAARLRAFRSRPTIRAGSLITTVFGDSIAPRGGSLWLGSLIELMADFGISERLVRTSVYRLAADDWLEAEQQGRRAYYRLTASGRVRFRAATHRIYGLHRSDWDGRWCLLLLPALDAAERDRLRRECGWLGFGQLSTNVLAHPSPDPDDLAAALDRLGVRDQVIIMEGETIDSLQAMGRLARDAWALDALDTRYARFAKTFGPVLDAMLDGDTPAPKTAFLVRTLLIQEYRKVLLRDPLMPAELLPAGWHGNAAHALCRDLYRRLHASADQYLTATVETRDGALPQPNDEYYERFGGLEASSSTMKAGAS